MKFVEMWVRWIGEQQIPRRPIGGLLGMTAIQVSYGREGMIAQKN